MYPTVIIDDEKNSLEVLEWQIAKYCESLKVVARCNNAQTGMEAVRKLKPSLVFLDIEMPQMNGFDLLQKLNPINFEVIFTTAHNEFAVKAFKVNALDYLLKPIDMNELKHAVSKFERRQTQLRKYDNLHVQLSPSGRKRIALTTNESLVFFEPENIIYCEASSNYTYFYLTTEEKKMLVATTLKDIEEIMVNYDFFRIHKSYLVNLKHIKQFIRGNGGHLLMSNGHHLTVTRTYKDEFFETFSKF